MSTPNEKVKSLAERLQDAFSNEGTVYTLPTRVYFENAPESVTGKLKDDVTFEDFLKAKDDYDATFIAGSALAFGNKSLDDMAKDEDLKETTFDFNILKDRLEMSFQRSYEKAQGIPKAGEERQYVEAYGRLDTKFVRSPASPKAGELKKVKVDLASRAAELLGKK